MLAVLQKIDYTFWISNIDASNKSIFHHYYLEITNININAELRNKTVDFFKVILNFSLNILPET